jgi:hypothetical protein
MVIGAPPYLLFCIANTLSKQNPAQGMNSYLGPVINSHSSVNARQATKPYNQAVNALNAVTQYVAPSRENAVVAFEKEFDAFSFDLYPGLVGSRVIEVCMSSLQEHRS